MHLVWRLENKLGMGVYLAPEFSDINDYWYYHDDEYKEMQPVPERDSSLNWSNIYKPGQWYFGFKSIEQLGSWFSIEQHRIQLQNAGCLLRLYSLESSEDVRYSEYQSVFIKRKGKVLMRYDSWSDLNNLKLRINQIDSIDKEVCYA